MKKFLTLTLSFLFLLVILSFLGHFLIDKKKIIQFITSEISGNIGKEISFNKNVKLSFFPRPNLIIKDLQVIDDSYFLKIEKVNFFSSWTSLISKEPRAENIILFKPDLIINNDVKKTFKFKNELYNQVNLQYGKLNFFERTNWFKLLEIYKGKLKVFYGANEYQINNFEMLFFNESIKKIEGSFNIDSLISRFNFKINTKDFGDVDLFLEHNFYKSKNISYIEGKFIDFSNQINFFGTFKSNFIDLDKFLEIKKFYSLNKNHRSYQNLVSSDLTKIPINFNINFLIDNVKYLKNNFSNVNFDLKLNRHNLVIQDLIANYFEAEIKLNSSYSKQEKKMHGIMIFENLSINEDILGFTDYDFFGGKGYGTIKFESDLNKVDWKEILKNFNAKGKINFRDVNFKGFDSNKIIKSLESIRNISDLLNALEIVNSSGTSNIDKITGDFYLVSGMLKINQINTSNSDLKVATTGYYNLFNENFLLDNKIKIKTKIFPDLPYFSVFIEGDSKNKKIKYKFDKFKEEIFKRKILKFKPGDFFEIPLNENKKIDLDKILDLF